MNDNDQKAEIVLADQMQFMLCEVVAEDDRKKKVETRLGAEELNVVVVTYMKIGVNQDISNYLNREKHRVWLLICCL